VAVRHNSALETGVDLTSDTAAAVAVAVAACYRPA